MPDALNETPAAAEKTAMQCCGNCNAWLCTDAAPDPRNKMRMGLCRARPPTPFLMQGPPNPLDPHQRSTVMVQAQFPPMGESGWCREWDTDADEVASPPT